MTTTTAHRDGTIDLRPDNPPITLDVRGEALLRYAELAIRDDFPADALPVAVAAMASPAVTCAEAKFADLVDAVRDRAAYVASPLDYADAHDWPITPSALDALDEKVAGNVDAAVWALLHPQPACVRCQRSGRPRERWNPANWPTSSLCTHHEGGEA